MFQILPVDNGERYLLRKSFKAFEEPEFKLETTRGEAEVSLQDDGVIV
jgi:hypothetical protein